MEDSKYGGREMGGVYIFDSHYSYFSEKVKKVISILPFVKKEKNKKALEVGHKKLYYVLSVLSLSITCFQSGKMWNKSK